MHVRFQSVCLEVRLFGGKEHGVGRAASMTAARAESVELEAMGLDGKTVPRRDFFLKTLDVAVLELHDLSAAGANKMIVVAFV